jgi:hypothetical protein
VIRNFVHWISTYLCDEAKLSSSVLLTLGPWDPGFPGGQMQGAEVEPMSLGPLRHWKR